MKTSLISKLFREYVMYIVLFALVIIFALTSDTFFSLQNLINIVNQNVYYLVMGVGVTMIMLSGALDLSIGYQVSTLAVIMGVMAKNGVSTPVIMITGIVAGVLLSTLNGVIYARLKVFPFIITLATQYILNGTTYLISNSKTFRDFDDAFNFLGKFKFKIFETVNFPIGILVAIVVILIGAFILNKTYFGRNIYALGSNAEAVKLSGVSVGGTRILVFTVAGFFFALATILTIGRTGASSSGTGVGAEFTVMAGAMLGGIKMGGGGGKINNMVVGVLIIGLLNNGMNLLNLSQYYQYIAMGIVLLFAISLDTLQTEAVAKRASMVMGTEPTKEKK